jgi:hypothetical protein
MRTGAHKHRKFGRRPERDCCALRTDAGAATSVAGVVPLVIALTLVFTGRGAQALTQTSGSGLTVSLNAESFGPGDTLVLTAKLSPLTTPIAVDAYVVVRIPTGQYLSLQLGGGLVPGLVPIARGFVPFPFEAPLVQYRFSGGEPFGEYIWYAGLSRPGTLDFLTAAQQLTFTLSASTPTTTRTNLSAAFRSGNLTSAMGLLGYGMQAKMQRFPPAKQIDVAVALETCTVVESTPVYQVCETPSHEFSFIFMQDDTGTWRVVVW